MRSIYDCDMIVMQKNESKVVAKWILFYFYLIVRQEKFNMLVVERGYTLYSLIVTRMDEWRRWCQKVKSLD